MTIPQRLRLIWQIIRGDSLAIIADRISHLPRTTIEHFADMIVHATQKVIEGMMDDMTNHTDLLNELMARMTTMELTQQDILKQISAINERLERGNLRFDEIDARLQQSE